MPLRHAVVAGVDFSEISPAVVRKALAIARKWGGRLVVVHVIEELTGGEEDGPLLPALRRRVADVFEEARQSMRRFLEALGLEGAEDVVSRIDHGPGGLCVARGEGGVPAALVVLGAPHPAVALGSFGTSILKRSAQPVLVSRRPVSSGYRNVLVGIDLSPHAETAWNLALDLAEPDAAVTACFVEEHPDNGVAPHELESWVRARSRGHLVAVRVETGSARRALVRAAEAMAADLVTVGRVGHRGLRELLLGSTAQSVAQKASCDVLVAGAKVHALP